MSSVVKSLMEKFGLREEDYCKEIADIHVVEFSRAHGKDWKLLPAYFEMDRIVVSDLEHKPGEEKEKRFSFLTEWKLQKGSDATYERLVYALLKIKCRLDAEAVCKMLKVSQESESQETSPSNQATPTGKKSNW